MFTYQTSPLIMKVRDDPQNLKKVLQGAQCGNILATGCTGYFACNDYYDDKNSIILHCLYLTGNYPYLASIYNS